MGLDEIVVRDLVRHPERRDELLGSAALLKLIGALLLRMFVFIGSFVNGMDTFTMTMVMVIAAAEVFKPWSVIEYHFQSRVEGRLIAVVNIVQTAAIAIAAGMRVDDLARVPLSFPTYAGILGRAAASAARQLNLEVDRSRFAEVL